MIRFLPDTWLEAFLRYFAMAAPNASVYIEIAAPDLRFAAMALLAAAAVLFWRQRLARARPVAALLVLVLVATVPWLMSSGNGRYWIAMLLCVGPVVVGLVLLLPLTRGLRLLMAGGLLAAQGFVLWDNGPWEVWGMAIWKDPPYFHFAVPRTDPAAPPVTYVTIASNSFSLVAPQFPASARWINLSSGTVTDRDTQSRKDFLAQAARLELLIPSIDGEVTPQRQPSEGFLKALDILMESNRLAIDRSQTCVLIESRGIVAMSTKKRLLSPERMAHLGFWMCPLLRLPAQAVPTVSLVPARTEAAFDRVEQMCPRFFPRGHSSVPIQGGVLRQYPRSDMKIYVMDNGQVKYKYWRSINATLIGTVEEVLDGKATLDCDRIRGRSGLPWQREI